MRKYWLIIIDIICYMLAIIIPKLAFIFIGILLLIALYCTYNMIKK